MEEQTIWKQMYLCQAGAMADAVDLMEPVPECRPAWARLNRALQEAEELYLSAGEEPECPQT